MRVIQLLPTVSCGDAVSNDALALRRVIAGMGIETAVYADIIDKRLPAGAVRKASKLGTPESSDILIYHKSTGTDIDYRLDGIRCRKMMIYHNITPPEFFRPYSTEAAARTAYGYEGLRHLSSRVDMCLTDSEYNKQGLLEAGFTCPIGIRPILIPFRDYEKAPDSETMRRFGDGRTNIIFVGRIAPNKRQEDVIRAFYFYKQLDPDARLILAGSQTGFENYADRLRDYADKLGLRDVLFTGHVSFPELLAYYRTATAFLCMSEHEGFCVPLVESMYFNVPIAARKAAAVPDTLGGSGLLLEDNDPLVAAKAVERLVRDKKLRDDVIQDQRRRLADFSYSRIKALFTEQLRDFIRGKI